MIEPIREPAAPTPCTPPVEMEHDDKRAVRMAAVRVTKLYPEPVARVLAEELRSWADFGYRFDGGRLIGPLVAHIDDAWKASGQTDAEIVRFGRAA